MNELKQGSMSDLMADRIAETLRCNVDEVAAILGIDVGTGSNDEKLSKLMAGVVMDRVTGRTIPDPAHELDSAIKDLEASGRPMPDYEQDIRATWVIQCLPYWDGKRIQPTWNVLWNVLMLGRFPHKLPAASVDGILSLMRRFDPLDTDAMAEPRRLLDQCWAALSDALKDICGETSAHAFSVYMRSAGISEASRAAGRVAPALASLQEGLDGYRKAAAQELANEIICRYGHDCAGSMMEFIPQSILCPEYAIDLDAVASTLCRFGQNIDPAASGGSESE